MILDCPNMCQHVPFVGFEGVEEEEEEEVGEVHTTNPTLDKIVVT